MIGLNQIFFAPLERRWSVFGRFPGYNPLIACSGFETQHCYYAPGDLGNQWFMFCLLTTNQFNGWKALLFLDVFITCRKTGIHYIYTPKHKNMFNSKGFIKLVLCTCQFKFLWLANGSNQNQTKATHDSDEICHIFYQSSPSLSQSLSKF